VIARDQNTGQWHVKDFICEHNHPMVEQDLACLLRSHRRISDEQKADIVAMQISGICKHQIMDIMEMLYGGYDKVGFTRRDRIISVIAIRWTQLLLEMLKQSSVT